MWMRRTTCALVFLTLVLVTAGCAPRLPPATPTPAPSRTPTSTPAPTATPRPQTVTVHGPRCPGPFRDDGDIEAAVTLGVGDTLTMTLESAPSVPCWWAQPGVGDAAVVHQVAHHSQWPSEDVTPKPGAPGTDFWVFEARAAGESEISVTCACTGDEGAGEDVLGAYVLTVRVSE